MNQDFQKNRRIIIFIGMSFLVVFIFALKDMLILLSKTWPHLYSVVNNPRASWEEIYGYLPFATHFSLNNLLPAAPMADPLLSKFTYFPVITMLVHGVLFKWIFFSNIDLYLLMAHTIFPLLSFWLIFLIFNRYIAISWSLVLAFFCVDNFPNFSLAAYISRLLSDPSSFIVAASLSPMELTRTPIPSFTFFFFILTFYLSIKENKPTKTRYLLMSLMWALNLYVYLFNFIAGIMFWFFYIIYTRYLKDRGFYFKNIIVTLLKNFLVVIVVVSPIIIMRLFFFSSVDNEIFQRMDMVSRSAGFMLSHWGWIISYVLPVLVVIVVIRIYCADYYELIYRFTPVFIMIFVEIFVSNLHFIFGEFFRPQLFNLRIADFFLRFLYFIPVIYFLSQPNKKLFHGDLKKKIADVIHSFCNRFIVKRRVLLVVLFIMLDALFVVFSSVRYYYNHRDVVAPRMTIVDSNYNELRSYMKDSGGLIVSEDIPVNLLIPVVSDQQGIMVDGSSNYVSDAEILERLILFAHIFHWDKQAFLKFMMPSDTFVNMYNDNGFILSDGVLRDGFGYWLLNNRRKMGYATLAEYKNRIEGLFERYNVNEGVKKYKIKVVHAYGQINPLLSAISIKGNAGGMIYILEGR